MVNLSVYVPIKTVSELNNRDHWTARNKRRREQQRAVYYAWRAAAFGKQIPFIPCVVRMIRFGPKELDSDNLVTSFKFCRDTVAQLLSVDDGDPRITFEYEQRLDTEYAVTIQVEARDGKQG